MADSAIVRVTGTVLRTEHKSGTARVSGNAYSMDILTVLVGGAGTTEIIAPSRPEIVGGQVPRLGEEIDWLVEVRRAERGFELNVLGQYSAKDAEAIALAFQSI